MSKVLLIGLGGFMGAAMRYTTGLIVTRIFGEAGFPYGTFAVNIVGSFLGGFVLSLPGPEGIISPTARLFFITGLLGAFTTFSTFSYETWNLFREGSGFPAVLNLGIHIIFGLAAVWMGSILARFWTA